MLQTGLPEKRPPGTSFEQYFEVVPAMTPALKDEAYQLRHQVFCEDLGFEPATVDRRERDEYDAQSLHLLIRSVQTGMYVGCTRIIRVRPEDAQQLLPYELICAGGLNHGLVDPATLPRQTIAEISRLAIVSRYRQRKGERGKPADISSDDFASGARSRFPYILIGLYLGTVEFARLHDIETLFVLTEPRLALHFRRLGVQIQTIGVAVEHHGLRIPSMMKVNTVHEELKFFFRPLYTTIASEIAAGLSNVH
jgi:N-acyl amino acid synthase of PEP-CTERM/exosortase system